VQLLAGPATAAITLTLPAVIVVPGAASETFWELQLGTFDFHQTYNAPWSQQEVFAAEEIDSGAMIQLPLIAPRPQAAMIGSSSFTLADDTRHEVIICGWR
jgi:hypothetical protein